MLAVPRYVAFLAALLLCPAGSAAAAEEEAAEPRVRLIVPGGTGGGSDLIARRLAIILGEPLGMPVEIVNRPAPEGLRTLAAASPDGLTLGFLGAEMLLDRSDPPRLTPIMVISHDAAAVHVSGDAVVLRVLSDVLAGEATASGGPAGSLWHLALAHVAATQGRTLPAAAWQAAADEAAALDLLTHGDVALVTAAPSQSDALRRAGSVTSVADPAVVAGLPQALTGWRGIVAPPGMSRRSVAWLQDAVLEAVTRDAFQHFMAVRGYRVVAMDAEAFERLLSAYHRELRLARSALE